MQVIFSKFSIILLTMAFFVNSSYLDFNCKSEICKAVYTGNHKKLKILLKKNKKLVNIKEKYNNSILHVAVLNQDIDSVNILIENKVNINEQDAGGATPLHIAARGGLVNIMASLIGANADIDAQDNEGFTPIMRATLLGKSDAVSLLLLAGSNCKLKTHYGQNLSSINSGKLSKAVQIQFQNYIQQCQAN